MDGVELDYRVINRIKRTIDSLTVEELLTEMEHLDESLNSNPCYRDSKYQEKEIARECCELRYYDMFGEESIRCPCCHAYITPDQEQRFEWVSLSAFYPMDRVSVK